MRKLPFDNTVQPICVGSGLVALDVVISNDPATSAQFFAGGSCGNVLCILSYFGWSSYPVARLSNNVATQILIEDFLKWNIKTDAISVTSDGSTPIIIQRIIKNKKGKLKHRFEFRNPENGEYLPSFKPVLAKSVSTIVASIESCDVYFFDRISRSSIDLALEYKRQGSLVFFEPSNFKDFNEFNKCLEFSDIVKFSNDRISDYDVHYPYCVAPLEIQTLGDKGLQFRLKGDKIWSHVPGYNIETLVDAAGAGDWCTAGIIMYLRSLNIKNLLNITPSEIFEAARFGQLLSAFNCGYEGARGLMYNYSKNVFIAHLNEIINTFSGLLVIKNSTEVRYRQSKDNINISSLTEPI
ncbi:carbohydrate kinase [Spirosoma sp. KCTC 42546]|uniref:PfkB family carbohydrate kinase n=1 Tax=Spirosoma sp. KCTC 42546 TaxID=2520506 RepID=UPI0011570556|nr:PfkB family carbohydrate kinase [Spirosoma sp. KCTC 42546]QDK82651.1 carbohydrate kinase [Spirosoma sp. KCTC 42546]